jgi:hypothetical protein
MAAHDKNVGWSSQLATRPTRETSGQSALAWRPVGRAPPSRRELRPAKLTPRGGQRSDRLVSPNSSTVPTAWTRTPCKGVGRGRGRRTRRRRACRRRWIPAPPHGACSHYLSGAVEPRMFMFPSSLAGARDQPRLWRRPEDQPPSGRGSAAPPSRWRIEVGQLPSWQTRSVQPPSRARRATW